MMAAIDRQRPASSRAGHHRISDAMYRGSLGRDRLGGTYQCVEDRRASSVEYGYLAHLIIISKTGCLDIERETIAADQFLGPCSHPLAS
jgi:hypothetical protein